ncbi:MAG: CotH kinase family protein [Planctomycetes bacterium]|nr:CotH kinase family protein [Planctomycetota bacterium]
MKSLSLAALAVVLPLSQLRAQVPDLYDLETVRDVYLQFSQSNWWTQLTNNYAPEINIAADMTVDGVIYPNVGVRFRGNTSYTQLPQQPNQGWEKKSFNVEMDWMVQGQDIYGYDSLNFNNGFHDPLFLREPLTYWVMRQHGVAPKANWIRLWLNGAYWGVYINVQQPNKDMMKEWFRSNDGNRYRCFPTSGGFQNGRCAYTVLSPNTAASYLSAYQAKQGDGTDLMNMCTVLNAMTTATPQSTLTNVFSVDAFYRYAAVMNVTTNTDSYLESGKDHFLYIDDVHGDGTTFPFDLNESMYGSTSLSPTYQTTSIYRPAFTKTLQFADWTQRYKAHLRAVIDHSFNPTVLTPMAQHYHALIYNDVVADTKKIYTTAAFQQNLTTSVTITGTGPGGGTTVSGLIPFLQNRFNYLDTNTYVTQPRAVLSNLQHTPALPNPTQTITVTVQADSLAASVTLWYRAVGRFLSAPLFDDGAHGDGAANDGTWGAVLAAQAPGVLLDYYVEAKTAAAVASYEPYTAELERNCPHIRVDWQLASSPIVINEFVAQNQNGPVDENNQHEDWVELYNTSSSPVDVGGMWLSDSLVVQKYEIPSGNVIPAFGVLRIWCDEDGTQGPLHANFKLSAGGEVVALWDDTGLGLCDAIVFGQQTTDVSTGRLVDGALPWVTFPAPTFMATNTISGCGQRIYGATTVGVHGLGATASGTMQQGTTIGFDITGGPANGIGIGALALGGEHIDLTGIGIGNEVLLLSPLTLALPATLLFDASGAANWSFPVPPGVAGAQIAAQSFSLGVSGWDSSRAVDVVICP